MGRLPARRQVPFGAHTVAEYALGAALVALGARLGGASRLLLLCLGVALFALNVATDGPLGAFRLCSRRVHHVADLVFAGLLAAAPLMWAGALHLAGVLGAEGLAVLLVWIERSTRYLDPPRPVRPPAPARPTTFATAGGLVARARPVAGRLSRRGARRLGVATAIWRRRARARAELRDRPRA